MSLWLAKDPLILASKSVARRAVLTGAGLPLEVCPADIDERALEAESGACDPAIVAAMLARAKAAAVAQSRPGRLVIGADQVLAQDGRRFSKPVDRAAARVQLQDLRGQVHELHSGLAVAQGGEILFEHVALARLAMRQFSDRCLDAYLDLAGDAVIASVGAYQLESLGVHLFDRIEGDHFTILGMPLLPLLAALRQLGFVAS